jgi:hypothetical protein
MLTKKKFLSCGTSRDKKRQIRVGSKSKRKSGTKTHSQLMHLCAALATRTLSQPKNAKKTVTALKRRLPSTMPSELLAVESALLRKRLLSQLMNLYHKRGKCSEYNFLIAPYTTKFSNLISTGTEGKKQLTRVLRNWIMTSEICLSL